MIRTFAYTGGLVLIALGLLGFVPALLWPEGRALVPFGTAGLLFGLVPASPLLNLIHLALGACGLLAASRYHASASYARAVTLVLGLLGVLAVLPVVRLVPSLAPLAFDAAWTHGLAALVAAYFGWGEPSRAYIKLL